MSTEPMIRKSTHDLALLIANNMCTANLPEETEQYFLKKKNEVIVAIRRGFILPGEVQTAAPPVIVQPPVLFKTSDTDLDMWLGKAEEFAKKHHGLKIKLRERFNIPEELPWKSVIPVLTPEGLDNRGMINLLKKAGWKEPYEEADVMKYGGSEASKVPTLCFIENRQKPDVDTMGMSPNQLRATGKSYLRLRGYGLAMMLYHEVTNEYLDPETFTWFPEERLSGGIVARGYWRPYVGCRQVRFSWRGPDGRYSDGGARVAIPVPLKS